MILGYARLTYSIPGRYLSSSAPGHSEFRGGRPRPFCTFRTQTPETPATAYGTLWGSKRRWTARYRVLELPQPDKSDVYFGCTPSHLLFYCRRQGAQFMCTWVYLYADMGHAALVLRLSLDARANVSVVPCALGLGCHVDGFPLPHAMMTNRLP